MWIVFLEGGGICDDYGKKTNNHCDLGYDGRWLLDGTGLATAGDIGCLFDEELGKSRELRLQFKSGVFSFFLFN